MLATLNRGPADGLKREVPDDAIEVCVRGRPAYPMPAYYRGPKGCGFVHVGYRAWAARLEQGNGYYEVQAEAEVCG